MNQSQVDTMIKNVGRSTFIKSEQVKYLIERVRLNKMIHGIGHESNDAALLEVFTSSELNKWLNLYLNKRKELDYRYDRLLEMAL